jgi:Spy/CpxP family protein refolding chaperone
MTDQATPPNPPAGDNQRPAQQPRRRRGLIFGLIVAVGVVATAVIATNAMSGYGPWRCGWHGGWHHGLMGGQFDPAWIEDRADRGVRHLAIEIDATPEQQTKLRAIVKSAVKELLPMRDKAHSAREQAHGLLLQHNLDRAAIEKFRAEQVALFDAASKRIAQALGDAAEVLTPEQRQKIGQFVAERRAYWRGWRRD